MQSADVQTFLVRLKEALNWAPDWAVPVLFIILTAVIAVIVHGIAVWALRRAAGERRPYLRSLLGRTRGATRLGLLTLIVSLALPMAQFSTELMTIFNDLLVVAFVLLTGWSALIATSVGTDLYSRRHDVSVDDNLRARKQLTQVRILRGAGDTLIVVITIAAALMTFENVRQLGVSLFASAGVAGLVVAFAARPVLSNLIAGVQIAVTQPIRIEDAVVVENEWGRVEEITSTYVVVRLWDLRRLIVPLSHFIEKPFQNWTRESAAVIGSVLIHADYTVPIERMRQEVTEIAKNSPLWDGKVANLQVTEAKENTLQLRALVSARTAPQVWDLRCEVREKLVAFLQREHPAALPRLRAELEDRRVQAIPAG
jgi:small-conductance mechanosensitive channel